MWRLLCKHWRCYDISCLSVCLFVCLSHCNIVSKQGNAEGCGLHCRVAQCLWFYGAKNGWWGTTLLWVQRGRPTCENSWAVHISPRNSGTVIDSEKSSINMNRKLTMGFPTSHQPGSCIALNFPIMGIICFRSDTKFVFFAEILTKNITQNFVPFGPSIPEICSQTDRHTTILCTPSGAEWKWNQVLADTLWCNQVVLWFYAEFFCWSAKCFADGALFSGWPASCSAANYRLSPAVVRTYSISTDDYLSGCTSLTVYLCGSDHESAKNLILIVTQRHSVAKNVICSQRHLFICLFVD